MNAKNKAKNQMLTLSTALGLMLAMLPARLATAVPIQGQFIDDPARCDTVSDTLLTHELGASAAFPIDELISVSVTPTTTTVCAPDDGIANDWEVRITNLSSIAYLDLFFVVDKGFGVGNADGFAQDLAVPGFTDAFRIDGTVTITGGNDNLLAESATTNEIFQPGETWTFLVTNFTASAPPMFDSIGFAASSSISPPSTASILANPVPEPASVMLLGLGGAFMLRRRRHGQM